MATRGPHSAKSRAVKWLLVSATLDEARGLPTDHPDVLDVLVTGVGKVAAASAVAARLSGEHADEIGVLNVGTAGGLREGLVGIVRPSTAWAWDFDAATLRQLGLEASDRLPLSGGDGCVIATGDRFIADDDQKRLLAGSCDVVDMECYAVVWAARQRGVRVEAVKWVSDRADALAADDWPGGVVSGAVELGRFVRAWLDRQPRSGS